MLRRYLCVGLLGFLLFGGGVGLTSAASVEFTLGDGTLNTGETLTGGRFALGGVDDAWVFNIDSAVSAASLLSVGIEEGFSDFTSLTVSLADVDDNIISGSSGSALEGGWTYDLSSFQVNQDYKIVLNGAAGSTGGIYTVAVQAVPIPAAVILFSSGLVALAVFGRRKSKRQQRESGEFVVA